MVEISMSGSGEGLGWATGPGYSTGVRGRLGCDQRIPTPLTPAEVRHLAQTVGLLPRSWHLRLCVRNMTLLASES